MIKLLTAYTHEPDDPEKAVEHILGQLDLDRGLLKRSVALLFCHMAFVDLGVTAALSQKLPCKIVGCSSQGFAVPGEEDEIMLTLTILTSDDTEFAVGLSESLTEDTAGRVAAFYREAAAGLSGEPNLLFAFQPTMINLSADVIFSALNQVCEEVPIFGTCAMDAGLDLRNPRVFFGGEAYADRMSILLFSGPVKPRFFSSLYPEKALFSQDAVITGVRDNLILSINNLPAAVFMEKMGLIRNEQHTGFYGPLFTIPLLIDYGGGSRGDIVIIVTIDENGALICSQTVQPGGKLNLGSTTVDYVLQTADALLKTIKREEGFQRDPPDCGGLFIFSCFSRNVALGDPMAEIRVVQRELADAPIPYVFFYSGGELCPQDAGAGETVNRFHQYAVVACLL